MTSAWLEELLPPSMVARGYRKCWLLFFCLFPLAYWAGILLEIAHERPAEIAGGKNRAALIREAETFAASKGLDVQGWSHYVMPETHADLRAYYGDLNDSTLHAANRLAPATTVTVLLRSASQKRDVRVHLSLTGEVLGYQIGKAPNSRHVSLEIGPVNVNTNDTNSSSGDRDEASEKIKEIARAALAKNEAFSRLLKLGNPTVSSHDDDPGRSDVEWEASPPGRPELIFHIHESIRNSQVVGQRVDADVEKSYAKDHLHSGDTLPQILNGFYGSFLTFGAIYAIFRYVKRSLQKEVSHARTFVVALLFFVSYSILIYSIGVDQVAVRVEGDTFVKVELVSLIAGGISLFVLGLLLGAGYGSGEGELRETFPGKLTSLDALLAGRIFSKNVAASVLFGAASSGWLLLFYQALSYFFAPDVAGLRKDAMSYTFSRFPWLTLMAGRQYDSLLIAVAGLLLPASFLLRRPARRKWRFGWFITFTLLAVLHDSAYPSLITTLLTMLVLVCALLLPFFAFDLLAAMVSLSALAFVDELARLCTVFPSWIGFASVMAAVALVVLLLAFRLSLSGRAIAEEQVRPLYAKNLAERMSMQAEILAAREAQLRLLPQAAPEYPGVEFAACCLPARGLGGDFYDFFQLDSHRVGIFVAQGGVEGLASALCIALAKGVLMYTSRQPLSPVEIILELEASFRALLEHGGVGGISFAYGVLDTRNNVLSYARLGDSPRLLLYRQGERIAAFPGWERVTPALPTARARFHIHEGLAQMQPGEQMIFYTQGISALRAGRFGGRGAQRLDMLMRELGSRPEPLQSSLASLLARYEKQAVDDLTAVVIGVTAEASMAREVVA